jgi:short-subunit dehydrogenase
VRSKKAIIVGASSGIGRALAIKLSDEGYELGLTARRTPLLSSLQRELKNKSLIVPMDVRNQEATLQDFETLWNTLGEVDLVIYNSGVDIPNPHFDWRVDSEIVEVNAMGFIVVAQASIACFLKQERGHLVGISSIAALKGNGRAPAYSASKAFMSTYLRGLRQKLLGTSISLTDIRPGYVDTEMIKNNPRKFWVASPERAASQIFEAIQKKKKIAYVTKRWWWIGHMMKLLPDFIYDRGFLRMYGKGK